MSDDRWPRPANFTDDLADGSVRRVWFVGESQDCTHVQIWMPDNGVEMFFSAKGCVDVRKYHGGATPSSNASDACDYVHVCDVGEFADALLRGAEHARAHWKRI